MNALNIEQSNEMLESRRCDNALSLSFNKGNVYQIIPSDKEKAIIIIHKQKLKKKKYLQMAREAVKLLKENKWNRIIMDVRSLTCSFFTIGEYVLTTRIAYLFPARSRLALLTWDMEREDIRFFTKFFWNHDIYFQAFFDFEKATEWLFYNE
jgi:leucyl aminopeptidase